MSDRIQGVVRKPGVPMAAWMIGAAIVAATAGVLWTRGRIAPAPPPAPSATAKAPAAVQQVDVPLPSPQDSDAQLRARLSGLTPMARFHDWLSASDLLSRWVRATDKIASDVSPRDDLPFLSPERPFKAANAAHRSKLSSRGYARFDAVAKVAASIDARKFAEAYRELHPLLESAYHHLGYPDRSIDAATAQALQRLADAPVRDQAPALERSGKVYVFADARLESLGPVEKALLRMGPHNTRLVQQEAREIASALNISLANAAYASK